MPKPKGRKQAPRKGAGRPTLKTKPMVEKICELARKGRSDAEIAKIVGVTQRTLTNWKSYDFEFLSTFNEARKIADDMVEASMFQRAIGYTHPEIKVFCNDGKVTKVPVLKHYPPDPVAGKFWLINRRPSAKDEKGNREGWGEKVEHSGPEGEPIEVLITDYRGKKKDD